MTTETENELASELGSEAEAFSPEELAELNAPEPEPQAEPQASDEPEPEPEPQEPDTQEPAKDPDRVDMVPHQALHAERLKARELKAQLDEQNGYIRKINETLLAQRETDKAPQAPDPNEDPIGHSQWKAEQLEKRLNQFEESATNTQKQQAEQQEIQAQWNRYIHERNTEAANIPHFEGAFQHLAIGLRDQLLSQGFPPEQVAQEVTNREWALAQQARSMGVSPARMLYAVAEQHGFKPKEAEPTTDAAAEAAAKLDKINTAQSTNVSLSQTGGAGSGELTLKDLAAMSGEELEAFAAKDPEGFAKLTG